MGESSCWTLGNLDLSLVRRLRERSRRRTSSPISSHQWMTTSSFGPMKIWLCSSTKGMHTLSASIGQWSTSSPCPASPPKILEGCWHWNSKGWTPPSSRRRSLISPTSCSLQARKLRGSLRLGNLPSLLLKNLRTSSERGMRMCIVPLPPHLHRRRDPLRGTPQRGDPTGGTQSRTAQCSTAQGSTALGSSLTQSSNPLIHLPPQSGQL